MKRLLVAISVLILSCGLSLSALADTHTPNQPGYWGEDCEKIDEYQGGSTWVADDDYRLVVLKSAQDHDVFEDVSEGTLLVTVSGKDISHIIVCGDPTPSTTSTTQAQTTTTTEDTTTTTQSPTSTSSSIVETTTTVESSTTSEVSPVTSTTTPERTELPYTGMTGWHWMLLGMGFLTGGVGLLRVARERTS